MTDLKLRFWPLLVGTFIMIWGAVTFAEHALGMTFAKIYDTYIWSIIGIIIGAWFIFRGTREPHAS